MSSRRRSNNRTLRQTTGGKKKKSPFAKACLVLLGIVVVIVLIHVVHALTLDRIIQYKEVSFRSPNVPTELSGYTIAFITDTHSIPEERFMEVVAELNSRQIDLLVIGGDITSPVYTSQQSLRILSQIKTADGIYAVDGNHDYYAPLTADMEQYSIPLLANTGLYVRDHLYLAGVQDPTHRNPNIADAIRGAKPDDFVLLLSHNPDVAMRQNTSGVDLILSGHTHGGQVTLFGLWAPLFTVNKTITAYGQHFRSGWAESGDGVPVYVSNGTGDFFIRVFARPQVILITLYPE